MSIQINHRLPNDIFERIPYHTSTYNFHTLQCHPRTREPTETNSFLYLPVSDDHVNTNKTRGKICMTRNLGG